MKLNTSKSHAAPAHQVEGLANQFGAVLDGLLDAGVHPHRVAEAALLAFLPLAMEVTRAPTIEDCLLTLAAKFDGNAVRRVN